MNHENIRELFENSKREIVIDTGRKEAAFKVLQKELNGGSGWLRGDNRGKMKIFIRQIYYMDRMTPGLQAGGGIVMFLVMVILGKMNLDGEDLIVCGMLLSTLLSAFSVLGMGRIFAANTAELSESCYFNVKQLIGLRMITSGILNLTVLFLVVLTVGCQWSLGLMPVALYMFVPYVMTQCGCVGVLLTESGRKNPYVMIGTGLLLCACHLCVASVPGIYEASAILFWGIAFAAGMMIMGIQVRILFAGLEKGEMLCMH